MNTQETFAFSLLFISLPIDMDPTGLHACIQALLDEQKRQMWQVGPLGIDFQHGDLLKLFHLAILRPLSYKMELPSLSLYTPRVFGSKLLLSSSSSREEEEALEKDTGLFLAYKKQLIDYRTSRDQDRYPLAGTGPIGSPTRYLFYAGLSSFERIMHFRETRMAEWPVLEHAHDTNLPEHVWFVGRAAEPVRVLAFAYEYPLPSFNDMDQWISCFHSILGDMMHRRHLEVQIVLARCEARLAQATLWDQCYVPFRICNCGAHATGRDLRQLLYLAWRPGATLASILNDYVPLPSLSARFLRVTLTALVRYLPPVIGDELCSPESLRQCNDLLGSLHNEMMHRYNAETMLETYGIVREDALLLDCEREATVLKVLEKFYAYIIHPNGISLPVLCVFERPVFCV